MSITELDKLEQQRRAALAAFDRADAAYTSCLRNTPGRCSREANAARAAHKRLSDILAQINQLERRLAGE